MLKEIFRVLKCHFFSFGMCTPASCLSKFDAYFKTLLCSFLCYNNFHDDSKSQHILWSDNLF